MRPGRLSLLLIAVCGAAPAGTARDAKRAQPDASQAGVSKAGVSQAAIQREAAEQARAAEAEEGRLAQQRIAAAARMRAAETKTADAATEIEGLAARRRDAEQRLAERAEALTPLLPLIERLALYPAETILAVPGAPEDTLRGLAVLHGLAQRLEQDAAALRAEQAAVQTLEQDIAAALPGLQSAEAAQATQAAELDRQIEAARAGRRRAEDAAADAARRAAAEAARADTLRAAIAAMEAEHARAEAQAREDAARAERQRQDSAAADARRRQAALARPAGPGLEQRGPLMTPVVGRVVRGWGDPTDAGPAQGVSYHSAPLARVVAPCSGRVAFSGPFRSFGVLLILDCGGGMHFVLAGLERLDVGVGVVVQRNEPVGIMPGWDPQIAAQPGAVRPTLYIELRRDGSPVNPAPFLRARG